MFVYIPEGLCYEVNEHETDTHCTCGTYLKVNKKGTRREQEGNQITLFLKENTLIKNQ